MNMGKVIAGISVAIAATLFFSIFIVKEVNQAIVLQFGDPKRIIVKPGLNFKIPFIQNVVFLDKRILNLDTPPEEVIASDQKRLIVDAFARFQIVDPLKFYISVGNERVARSRLATIINSRIRNVLGQQELQTLLSEDRTKQMALISFVYHLTYFLGHLNTILRIYLNSILSNRLYLTADYLLRITVCESHPIPARSIN